MDRHFLKKRSLATSLRSVLRLSIAMIVRFCTETWSLRIYSWREPEFVSSVILASRKYWMVQSLRRTPSLEHQCIYRQRFYRTCLMTPSRTSGRWASCCMSWLLWGHHGGKQAWLNSVWRSATPSSHLYPTSTLSHWRTWLCNACRKGPARDLTSKASWVPLLWISASRTT